MAGYVIWIFLILLLKLVILIYICLKSEEIKKRRQNNPSTQAQRSTRHSVEEANEVPSRADNITNTHNTVFVISSQNDSKNIKIEILSFKTFHLHMSHYFLQKFNQL